MTTDQRLAWVYLFIALYCYCGGMPIRPRNLKGGTYA